MTPIWVKWQQFHKNIKYQKSKMDLKRELTSLLIDSLEELIKIGSSNSFWGATRANSDAILALTTCLPEFDYYKLRSKCIEKIIKEANENNQFINWDEEIWDTSIAIMALSSDIENSKTQIWKALSWIESKYIKLSQSWNEEVWETLLALNAITYSEKNKNNQENNYFEGSINWINSLYDTPKKGILINWSSTALYLLFAVNSSKFNINTENKKIIKEHIKASCEQILNSSINTEESVLWTSETWSNGLVLWAISEAKMGMFDDEKLVCIINWFRQQINLEDTPIEDKAFACIGLYKYLEYIEITENGSNIQISKTREKLQLKLSKLLNLRVKDFEPKPPLFDKNYHSNYYTINLSKRTVNIILIIIFTVLLTYFSILTSNENDNFSKWLSIIPILLGVFATVSQLMNFEILPSNKNKNNEK